MTTKRILRRLLSTAAINLTILCCLISHVQPVVSGGGEGQADSRIISIFKMTAPVSGYVVSRGYRPRSDSSHGGFDLAVAYGTNIVAPEDGVMGEVRDTGDRSYGYYFMINHGMVYVRLNNVSTSRYQVASVRTLYAHCIRPSAVFSEGNSITQGEHIADVNHSGGVRGRNGGDHLHFEIEHNEAKVDPSTYYSF